MRKLLIASKKRMLTRTSNFKEHLRGIFKATTRLPSDTMNSHLSHRSAFPPNFTNQQKIIYDQPDNAYLGCGTYDSYSDLEEID